MLVRRRNTFVDIRLAYCSSQNFDIPVDNLFTMPLFAHYYRQQALVGKEVIVFA